MIYFLLLYLLLTPFLSVATEADEGSSSDSRTIDGTKVIYKDTEEESPVEDLLPPPEGGEEGVRHYPKGQIPHRPLPRNPIPRKQLYRGGIPRKQLPSNSVPRKSLPHNPIPRNKIERNPIDRTPVPRNRVPRQQLPRNRVVDERKVTSE